jgi:hypothetical protein
MSERRVVNMTFVELLSKVDEQDAEIEWLNAKIKELQIALERHVGYRETAVAIISDQRTIITELADVLLLDHWFDLRMDHETMDHESCPTCDLVKKAREAVVALK